MVEHGFAGQSWLTFRQALALGGSVRKGERGTTVVYADRFTPEEEREHARRGGETPAGHPLPQALHGLQRRAMRGLPDDIAAAAPPVPEGLILP